MAGPLHRLSTEPVPGGDGVGEVGSRECGWEGEMCCACWNPLVFISGLPWGMRSRRIGKTI